MAKEYRFYCAGEWRSSDQPLEVINPYNGEVVGTTSFATDQDLEDAITAAERAFEETRRLQSYERAAILERLADGLEARQEEFARLLAQEAGKPIRDARTEVARGVFTLRTAVEEAKRIGGELIPLDWMASSQGRFGVTRRFPIGPIAGISPFNFPLNLALHKVAPAIASGNTIVLKPPTHDPLTMLTFAELIDEAGLPKGAVSIMPMDRTVGDRLVTDPRFKMLSFTGSPAVGWDMKSRAGKKKVVLELGGNAGVVVDKDANLPLAISRVRVGAFAYAGQVCIAVQRVYIHRSRYDEFVDKFVAAVKEIKIGDPLDEAGTMLSLSWAPTGRGPDAPPRAVRPSSVAGATPLSTQSARRACSPSSAVRTVTPASSGSTALTRAPVVSRAPASRAARASAAVTAPMPPTGTRHGPPSTW